MHSKSLCLNLTIAVATLATITCGAACGTPQATNEATNETTSQTEALRPYDPNAFSVRSAAFDITDKGFTKSIVLVVSNQNDVCHNVLNRIKHPGEYRIGMFGLSSGDASQVGSYVIPQPRRPPPFGTALLNVPLFEALDGACHNQASRVTSGSMTIEAFESSSPPGDHRGNPKPTQARASYMLYEAGAPPTQVVTRHVVAALCPGINDIHVVTSSSVCR